MVVSSGLVASGLVVDRSSKVRAVDGVDLRVDRGQICFVLGPNGSGKSTLLRALAGLDPAREGTVSLDGVSVRRMRAKARARRVAWLSQGLIAPRGIRVRELVASARYPRIGPFSRLGREDEAAIDDALRDVDMLHHQDRVVGRLSGGELERALLARCFAQESEVLLLDEPTAALDPVHCLEFLRRLEARVRERSCIAVVATHDLNLAAQSASSILLLDSGRAVAVGAPDDVFARETLACLYGPSLVLGRRWSEIANAERPWVLAWDDGGRGESRS